MERAGVTVAVLTTIAAGLLAAAALRAPRQVIVRRADAPVLVVGAPSPVVVSRTPDPKAVKPAPDAPRVTVGAALAAAPFVGVTASPDNASVIAAWAEADGVRPDSFRRFVERWLPDSAPADSPIHRLETGALPGPEFERLLAAELVATDGRRVDPAGLLGRMFAQLHPDSAMFDLVHDLRASGVRVGLVSNSWANTYPRAQIEELFDPVVISCEVGLRKPDRAIYELALASWGLPAAQVVFVDDAGPNAEGARSAGLVGVRHLDALTTRQALAERLPELSSPALDRRPATRSE